MAQPDRMLLVHLFIENNAAAVRDALLEGKSPAVPTDLTTDSGRGEASPLTGRELDVLGLLALGLETKEIAVELGLSPHTVRSHVSNARKKLKAKTKLAAVLATRKPVCATS